MKKLLKLFFPALSLVIFATLLWAMLLEWTPSSVTTMLSFGSGLLAYSVMLTLVIISVRPKVIEKHVGLPDMYAVHGWMAMTMAVAIIIHVFKQWNGFENIFSGHLSNISLTGFIAIISLIVVMLTGIFVLSNVFIQRSKNLMRLKENYFKRERHLWLHRLALVSIVAIYFHMFFLGFLSSNTTYMTLLTVYTVGVLGWYLFYKISLTRLPKYVITNISRPTPNLYEIELEPTEGQAIMTYKAGQYAFIRFVDSSISKESHPFSLSSAPSFGQDNLQMIIKEMGDFTKSLSQVEVGDKVTLEGPYGNYFPHETVDSHTPMVLMSGGIGVTPNLSILRHEIAEQTNRRIVFVWGITMKNDLMFINELRQLEKEWPNFSYHIIFSGENVEGYPHGFISDEFLAEIGVNELYSEANFYICGPAIMINHTKKLLQENNVDPNHVFLEEFAF